jgi:type I restriction enzyme S subunit
LRYQKYALEYIAYYHKRADTNGYKIMNNEMASIHTIVPSLFEQERIANYLDNKCEKIDKMIAKEQVEIEKLKKYKQSIITEIVTRGLDTNIEMKKSDIEWIREIPRCWGISKLKYIFKFGKGLPITKEDLKEEGVPVISYGQVHSKENTGLSVSYDLIRYVDNAFKDNYPNCIVKKGEFIFADTSEDLDGCGNAVYNNQNDLLLAGYHSIIFKSELSDNKYFAYLFQTDCWRSQIRCRSSGIKLFSITQKILKEVSICIPTIKEQQEIANYLDNKCGKIELIIKGKNKKIEQLKTYKKSLIYECVTGKKEI